MFTPSPSQAVWILQTLKSVCAPHADPHVEMWVLWLSVLPHCCQYSAEGPGWAGAPHSPIFTLRTGPPMPPPHRGSLGWCRLLCAPQEAARPHPGKAGYASRRYLAVPSRSLLLTPPLPGPCGSTLHFKLTLLFQKSFYNCLALSG